MDMDLGGTELKPLPWFRDHEVNKNILKKLIQGAKYHKFSTTMVEL